MDTHMLKKQMTAAYQYSFTRLALNYYTYYETMTEDSSITEQMKDYTNQFNLILKQFLTGKDVEEELETLRNRVIHQVEILMAYSDCFQIYEYALNRQERRFKTLPEIGYSDEDFTEMLLDFVTGSEDAVVMNGRIQEIIGQLPIRFTRQKFFGLVTEGLSAYTGSSRKSLEDMLYMLRTSSMAALPEDMDCGYGDLYGILNQFRHLDFKQMTETVFDDMAAKITYISTVLLDESSVYMMLADMINDLYVLLLAGKEALMEVHEQKVFTEITGRILEHFLNGDGAVLDDHITDMLTRLEGRQETYYERYSGMNSVLSETGSEDVHSIRIHKIDRLLSGSSFASLDEAEEPDILVDASWLEQKTEEYFMDVQKVFSQASRPVSRAVMARVLASLPICFNSREEIRSYIIGSLESCADSLEKETCKELLLELMESENALV